MERTPEEEVRQGLIKYLYAVCGAPLGLMSAEAPLHRDGMDYRADLLLLDRRGNALLIAECKAPHIAVNNKVFEQILRYNSILHVPFLLLTNGREMYFCRQSASGACQFRDTIPSYTELCDESSR